MELVSADVADSGGLTIEDASVNQNADNVTLMNVSGSTTSNVTLTLTWQTTDVTSDTTVTADVDDEGGDLGTQSFEVIDVNQMNAFADGGVTFWTGQNVFLRGQTGQSGQTYQVRSVDSSGDNDEVGTLISEITTGQNGAVVVNTGTSSFEAGEEYVITTENRDPVVFNDTGAIVSVRTNFDASSDSLDQYSWEMQSQTLNAEWEDSSVSNEPNQNNNVDLDVDSNRAGFDLTVSASGLDTSELRDVFRNENVIAWSEDDDTVTIGDVGSSETLTGNFTDIDADDYNFQFEAADTTASAQTNISVTEETGSMALESGSVVEQRGDWAEFTASFDNTGDGFIGVGSDSTGYNVTLAVEDGGDGQVSVRMNTFLAGLKSNNANDLNWSNATTSGTLTQESRVYELTESADDDGDEITDIYVHSQPLSDPLEAGSYDITVSASAETANGADSDTAAGSGPAQYIENEDDIATLELRERGTQGITMWSAAGDADFDELDELRQHINQSNRIAGGTSEDVGDYAVVRLQASGLFGQIEEGDVSSIYQNNGMELTIEEASPGANQEAAQIDLSGSSPQGVAGFYTDEQNNSVFLVIDTKTDPAGSLEFETDESYTASWEINESNPLVEADDETSGVEKETASQDFQVLEPDAEFENTDSDDVLQVAASENATVSGTTNLAQGSEVTVRLRNSGNDGGQAFLKSATTTVQSGGTFSTALDMSNVDVGTNFTAVVRRSGTTVSSEYDAVAVEQVQTETPSETTSTPSETTSTPSETTTSTGETTTADTTTTSTGGNGGDTTTTTTSNTPGFGMIVALVALVAAALLAVRREN